MGGPVTNSNADDYKDIIQAKLYSQRMRIQEQQKIEAAKAKKNTDDQQKKADQGLATYKQKMDNHKQNWYNTHGHRWNQKKWEESWKKDGAGALAELNPTLAAYDAAVQNELIIAAQESPATLKEKETEIKGRQRGGWEDDVLDDMVATDGRLISHETPALMTAWQNYQTASSTWIDAQQTSLDDRKMNTYLQQSFEAAQSNFLQSQTEYFNQLGLTLDEEIQKGLKAGQKPEDIEKNLQEIFGDQYAPLIHMRVEMGQYAPQVADLAAKFRANPNDPSFSPAEKSLAQKGDFHTLAFLRLAKVQFGQDGSGATTLSIDGKSVPLSKQEQEIAKNDPLVLSLLKLGKVSFSEDPSSADGENFLPKVTVDGKGVMPGKLPAGSLDAWRSGNYTGFALSLFQLDSVQVDPSVQALMAATSQTRLDWTTAQVKTLMNGGNWREAQKVLKTNMDAAFSPDERAAIWQQAGLPNFTQDFIDKQIDVQLKKPDRTSTNPDDIRDLHSTTMYADKVGVWMQDFLKGATPELGGLVLDRVKAKFGKDWYKSNEYDSTGAMPRGEEFFKGLSMAVGLNPQRADEVVAWLTDTSRDNPAGTLLYELRGSAQGMGFDSVRDALKDGTDPTLASGLLSKIASDKQFANMEYEFQTRFNQGTEGGGSKIAEQQHLDFSSDSNKRVQAYFDHFLGDPNIGHNVSIKDKTQLRDIAGRAMGFTPTQNLAQATSGDTSVEWYSTGSHEYDVADLLATWILNQGGDHPNLLASPTIYDSKQGGVQYGALFQVTGADGKQVVIDGNAAEAVVTQAAGNPYTDIDDQKVDPWQANVNWHYTSFKKFQDENDYSDEGQIYFMGSLDGDKATFNLQEITDDKQNRHVQWAATKLAITTTGEKWESYGNKALMVVVAAGGVLLALPSGGTSLTLVGAGLAIGGLTGMGALTTYDRRKMQSHGQSVDWSNPAARAMYVNLIAQGISTATLGLGTMTKLVALSGTKLAAEGVVAGDSLVVAQGATRLQTAQTLAAVTRPVGYVDAAFGTTLMGNQMIDLARNWDQMTASQRGDAMSTMMTGFATMAAGAAATRVAHHYASSRPSFVGSPAGAGPRLRAPHNLQQVAGIPGGPHAASPVAGHLPGGPGGGPTGAHPVIRSPAGMHNPGEVNATSGFDPVNGVEPALYHGNGLGVPSEAVLSDFAMTALDINSPVRNSEDDLTSDQRRRAAVPKTVPVVAAKSRPGGVTSGSTIGARKGWTGVRIEDPATGKVIGAQMPVGSLRKVNRTSGEDSVIGMDRVFTLGPRQTPLQAGKLPKWLLINDQGGNARVFSLTRVGVLGKKALGGVDGQRADEAVMQVRKAIGVDARRAGKTLVKTHGANVVLAAVGLPVMLISAKHGAPFMMAAVVPPGGGRRLSNLLSGKHPVMAIKNTLGAAGRNVRRKVQTYKREAVFWTVNTAGAGAAFETAFHVGNTTGGPNPFSTFIHTIMSLPDAPSMYSGQITNYLLFALRAVPSAVVAITAARATRARWSGTTQRGLALRGVISSTFNGNAVANGFLLFRKIGHATNHAFGFLSFGEAARLSTGGFFVGQGLMGGRALRGGMQGARHGRFVASAATDSPTAKVEPLGSPGESQVGKKWRRVARSNSVDSTVLKIANSPGFRASGNHTVGRGETWASVAENVHVSEAVLHHLNPSLNPILADGDVVVIPTSSDMRNVVSGRKIGTHEILIPDPVGGPRKIGGTSQKGKKWGVVAAQTGMSETALRILNDPGFNPAEQHTATATDSWATLAAQYGYSVERLRQVNPDLGSELAPLDVVAIPTFREIRAMKKRTGKTIGTDTIQIAKYGAPKLEGTAGKTWKWAEKQTGVPAKVLQILNSSELYLAGRKIWNYKVKEGDDLASVAKALWITETELQTANPGVGVLTKGQKIKIPVPDKVAIPKTADWQWVERIIRTHRASRGKSLKLTQLASGGQLELGQQGRYSVTSGEGWSTIAGQLGIPEAELRALNPGQSSKNPTNLPGMISLITPDQLPVPARTDMNGMKTLIGKVVTDTKGVMKLNMAGNAKIPTAKIRVPRYSWEADSQTSRWLQTGGAMGLAEGSGVLLPLDALKYQGVPVFRDAAVVADAGIAVGNTATSTLAGSPNRKSGTLAKRFPKTTAVGQATAGLSLGLKGVLNLLGYMGLVGRNVQDEARK